VVRKLLTGNASQTEYALLLRNLLPAYEAMESQLDALAKSHAVAPIRDPRLYRAAAIRADLAALCGNGWEDLPLTVSGREYGLRVRSLQPRQGCRIAGHCYTRYLGDLSGGQILRGLLSRKPGLPAAAMNFFRFDVPGDPGAYKVHYIQALNSITDDRREMDAIVDEAVTAFRLNIALSEELASLRVQSGDGGSGVSGTSGTR